MNLKFIRKILFKRKKLLELEEAVWTHKINIISFEKSNKEMDNKTIHFKMRAEDLKKQISNFEGSSKYEDRRLKGELEEEMKKWNGLFAEQEQEKEKIEKALTGAQKAVDQTVELIEEIKEKF